MAVDSEKNGSGDTGNSFGGQGYYDNFTPGQAEKGGQSGAPRKMSRIDRPVTKSISGSVAGLYEDDDEGMTIGKQLELEEGNAIKYRTCSWPKV